MTTPEALRLAQELDAYHTRSCHKEAAAELRRQHAVIVELVEALELVAGVTVHSALTEQDADEIKAKVDAALQRAKEQR